MQPKLEKISLSEKQSILAFKYVETIFDAPWHFHPQHELTYIEKSKGSKFVGDFVGPYQEGELVLVRSNLPHCWKVNSKVSNEVRSYVIQWNTGIYAKVPEMNEVFNMLRISAKGIIFDSSEIHQLIPLIKRTVTLEGIDLYLELQSILVQLSSCSYRTLSESSFINEGSLKFNSRMAKVHDFVDQNYHHKIKLNQIADLISMSEQSFSRFFSKTMGRSFFTFLNEYRINIASRMLIDTDIPIAQIGYACGFDSLPFFYKKFQLLKKETPKKYRKKYTSYKSPNRKFK